VQRRKAIKLKSVPIQLVTVGVYDYAEEAQANKIKLESAGLRVWLADEKTNNADWLLKTALGGIKLQVDQTQAEKAVRILESTGKIKITPVVDKALVCPTCGSADVRYERFATRWVFLSILLAGFPLPFLAKKWHCKSCGQIWQATKE
jgi:hypothetical protein